MKCRRQVCGKGQIWLKVHVMERAESSEGNYKVKVNRVRESAESSESKDERRKQDKGECKGKK